MIVACEMFSLSFVDADKWFPDCFIIVVHTYSIFLCNFVQEKELIEKHNAWLNEELSAKVNSLIEERKTHLEVVADMSAKISNVNVLISEYYCLASEFRKLSNFFSIMFSMRDRLMNVLVH